jgi:hypothetical protein
LKHRFHSNLAVVLPQIFANSNSLAFKSHSSSASFLNNVVAKLTEDMTKYFFILLTLNFLLIDENLFRWALPEASVTLWSKLLDAARHLISVSNEGLENGSLQNSLNLMRIYLYNVVLTLFASFFTSSFCLQTDSSYSLAQRQSDIFANRDS